MDRLALILISAALGLVLAYGAVKTAERIANGTALEARARTAGVEQW